MRVKLLDIQLNKYKYYLSLRFALLFITKNLFFSVNQSEKGLPMKSMHSIFYAFSLVGILFVSGCSEEESPTPEIVEANSANKPDSLRYVRLFEGYH